MYSGLITGHVLLVAGGILAALNLTLWYRDIVLAIQGAGRARKPRLTDGLLLLSGMALIMGGVCCIVHWVIDYRLIPACQ
jgi:hypothetical protein